MVVLHILVKRSEQFFFCELSPQIINVFKNPSCHIKCTVFLDHISLLFLTFASLNCNSFHLPLNGFYQSRSNHQIFGFAASVNNLFILALSFSSCHNKNHSFLLLPGLGSEDKAGPAEGGVGEDEGVRPTAEEQAPVHRRFQGV